VADTNAAVVAQQRAQRERNQATAANWRAYLGRLASVALPSASQLRDTRHFPAGLTPLEPGVAEAGDGLLVLPAETVAAVSYAVDAFV
jgi:peptidoglycan DL-endopeptidase CwlO